MKKKALIILGVILVVIVLALGTYKLMNSRTYQVMGNITNKINTDKKVVALTFDDGPTKNTDKILDILNEEDVKATFYLIGSDIEKNLEEGKK
ncbi:polysaccharide deacetylase family protein [[Clostridium] dakarense]|uniref:polysaccharide deacetylase family protein n=1 Tax=Faecalimicrobium dakarense TaxID=1301100 RepID=UPI0004AF4A86|nr:polysaccharide deacetylase family protein [[Clostridium] dakarense]